MKLSWSESVGPNTYRAEGSVSSAAITHRTLPQTRKERPLERRQAHRDRHIAAKASVQFGLHR